MVYGFVCGCVSGCLGLWVWVAGGSWVCGGVCSAVCGLVCVYECCVVGLWSEAFLALSTCSYLSESCDSVRVCMMLSMFFFVLFVVVVFVMLPYTLSTFPA